MPIWAQDIDLTPSKQAQRVFVTSDLHDLVLLMKPETAGPWLIPVKVSLNNGIAPVVRSAVTLQGAVYHYAYAVRNDGSARDNIINLLLVAPPFLLGTEPSYRVNGLKSGEWGAGVGSALVGRQSEMDRKTFGRNIYWGSMWDGEHPNAEALNILPGRTKTGFEVDSAMRPGFTTVAAEGLAYEPPEKALADPEIGRQLASLHVEEYFDVTTLTFGPMFVPGAPASEVLANYRLGLARLSECAGIRHSEAFLHEISSLLNEPGIELILGERLDSMRSMPTEPIEKELMTCLRLVAKSFSDGRKH